MLRNLFAISLCFLLLGCFSSINGLNRRETNQRSTYLLTIPSGGQCSGVVLTSDGYILTAGHCTHNHTETLLVHSRDNQHRTEARVIAVDESKDLALLKVDDWNFQTTALLHSGRSLQTGDTIYHSGFPFGRRHGLPQLFGVGHIMNPETTLEGNANRHFILIDLETGRPGASGSGVYDAESGGLIGMVDAMMILTGRTVDRMTVVILVPVSDIREFLLANGLNIPSTGDVNLWSGVPPEVNVANVAAINRSQEK